MKTTTPTKLLTGQWGAAMNYIETHKPVLINNRDHRDIVMVLATDYEEMKQKCEALEHELAQFQWIDVNERLPETDDEFIVCVSGDVVTCEFNPWTCGEGEGSYQWFEWQDVPNYGSEKCLITGVTHWMPLPKPPTNKL